MPGAGLVVAGAVESDRGGDHAEDQDERGRERRQVEAGAPDRVGAEGERGAGAVHGEEHAADSRRHATEAREQGGADKPDPPRPAQAEDRGRQPRPGGSDRERADRVSHPALSASRSSDSAETRSSSRPTATSSPWSRASGLGGQPGTYTSTGTTRSIAPCTSSSPG